MGRPGAVVNDQGLHDQGFHDQGFHKVALPGAAVCGLESRAESAVWLTQNRPGRRLTASCTASSAAMACSRSYRHGHFGVGARVTIRPGQPRSTIAPLPIRCCFLCPSGPCVVTTGVAARRNGSLRTVVETVVHGRGFTPRRSTTGASCRKPIRRASACSACGGRPGRQRCRHCVAGAEVHFIRRLSTKR